MIKKILISTIFIYYGIEAIATWAESPGEVCLGWNCKGDISCPKEYAIWIPEEKAFLPCEHWDIYINTGNKSVLK